MSDATTKVMLEAYRQEPEPVMFLSGKFQSPRRNFHNSEEVEIDIVRSGEDIAIAVQALGAGRRMNQEDLFTNKGYKPPIFREGGVISAESLIQRQPGQDPFQGVNFQANAVSKGFSLSRKLQAKISRTQEVQASQILQTGIVTLNDENGAAVYSIDFKPKATHFPTTSNNWGAGGETPISDLISLANVIRADGKQRPDQLYFGEGAFENFIQNTDVKDRLDRDGLGTGTLVPTGPGNDAATFQGWVKLGHYRYEMWTYDGQFLDPETSAIKTYIDDDKVIMRASTGRLDATFGGIPLLGAPDPRVPRALVSRISDPGTGLDMQLNAWVEKDRTGMTVEAMARTLLIPTAIDTFGCLDTQI